MKKRILEQKWCRRSRMRRVNTHNKFQTPRTIRTGVMSRIVFKKKNSSIFFWNFGCLPPMRGATMHKKFQPSRAPRTQATGVESWHTPRQQQSCCHSLHFFFESVPKNEQFSSNLKKTKTVVVGSPWRSDQYAANWISGLVWPLEQTVILT